MPNLSLVIPLLVEVELNICNYWLYFVYFYAGFYIHTPEISIDEFEVRKYDPIHIFLKFNKIPSMP